MKHSIQEAEQYLRDKFGLENFRPHQDRIVESILNGEDVLCIMPTGGGKSLCYQLPALLLEGTTIVVSPLIALMKDQVDALEARGIPAAAINSTQSSREQWNHIQGMVNGDLKLVYIAPERFRHQGFVEQIKQANIVFVAVDEAHCVSQWGHDFRPDYLRLGKAIGMLKRPIIGAFTATATPEVRQDITKFLNLHEPGVYVTGFSRPNLEFRVTEVSKHAEKYSRIGEIVDKYETGIIYCATRKHVEDVSERLEAWEIPHVAYHGGMEDRVREAEQNRFIRKEVNVAVATNAFGMGIDRADIRFVVHFELPGSVEAYYQEAGRAGRDGLPSLCELLFNYADRKTQDFFIDGNNPTPGFIRQVYAWLRSHQDEQHSVRESIQEMARGLECRNTMQISTVLKWLLRAELIERFDLEGERIRGTRLLKPEVNATDIAIDEAALLEKERRDRSRLESLIAYASCNQCRQLWIRKYFGEPVEELCECCDWCREQGSAVGEHLNEQQMLVLRKALSGVARMSDRGGTEKWVPRFGKGLIVQMLVGSDDQRVHKLGLSRLSTYGLLKPEGTAFVRKLLDECLRRGLLRTTGGTRPLVTLTNAGEAAMKNEINVILAWPEPEVIRETPAHSQNRGAPLVLENGEPDEALLDRLKKKRLQLAKVRGNVPPYKIFSNSVLEGLAAAQPLTEEDALQIKGIGPAKARKVLKPFLEEIAAWRARC